MTSKEINNPASGFYYDEQLDNKLTKVSLHPSTEPGPAHEYSKEASGEKLEDGFYRKAPLCQSVITEDFQVSVANTFSDFGGDALGSFWNSAVKPLSPYLEYVKDDLKTIAQKSNEFIGKYLNPQDGNPMKSAIGKAASIGTKIIEQVAEKGDDITSRSLIVQGTMFSYYAGTGVDFGTLSMKFVVFSGYDKSGSYQSVADQIDKIKWYVIGEFIPVEDVGDLAKEFAFWQMPPGGYKANIKTIDVNQWGTLKLLVGPFYAIENLVIQSAQFNYSKTLCKRPDKGDSTMLDPLYCDVTLNLKAVSKFSAQRVFDFAHGNRSKQYRCTEFEQAELQPRLSALKGVNGSPSGIGKM